LTVRRLEEYAAQLGSDCAFFVRGGTALATGRGERLERLTNRLPPMWLVVVFPGFPSATAEAYRRVQPAHYKDGNLARRMARALEKGDTAKLTRLTYNEFFMLVAGNDVRYKRIQDDICRERLQGPWLSGSGSSMFAIAKDRRAGMAAAEHLRTIYPLAVAVNPRRVGVRVSALKQDQ
jgi:4-diphosphocytidyl-2-C-methyl-D-erythritol kinase